ncbi:MAG: adenine phosphoribosyltransferase [Candidatus Marinimicrobia bacterium]|nr:adenine phosphoribosyltransferase [Candidatus Neomarinimicrobiota bacterium]
MDEKTKELIKSKIRTIPDFPIKGIMFRDITTLLKDTEGYKIIIDDLVKKYKEMDIDIVAGIESRGFIIGGALAYKLNLPFVPIRKPGKLPGEYISQEYSLEYGSNTLQIHKDSVNPGQNVLLIDDLLATGGSAKASIDLIEKLKGIVKGVAFIIELPDLGGRKVLSNYNVYSIVKYFGE